MSEITDSRGTVQRCPRCGKPYFELCPGTSTLPDVCQCGPHESLGDPPQECANCIALRAAVDLLEKEVGHVRAVAAEQAVKVGSLVVEIANLERDRDKLLADLEQEKKNYESIAETLTSNENHRATLESALRAAWRAFKIEPDGRVAPPSDELLRQICTAVSRRGQLHLRPPRRPGVR